ncbi:MAG TPA: hypothetical protein VL025_16215, partial [Thermoanaerobaculia bacterium]|nr:hypothetical protein [Thermoanaerobaculia bacterium]
ALRRDQGRLDEALALAARAADLMADAGDPSGRATARVELGLLALHAAETGQALAAFGEALAAGAARLPSFRVLQAVQGTALALGLEGRTDEALAALADARSLFRWPADSAEGLALDLLEGRLALEDRLLALARTRLSSAFHGFAALGHARDAVLSAVHLTRALLAQRAPRRELRELAGELRPLLGSPEMAKAARQALAAFVEDLAGTGPTNGLRLKELSEILDRGDTIGTEPACSVYSSP